MAADITETIKIICADCKCSLSHSTEISVNEANTTIERVIKIFPCERCVRDTFDEAYKIMKDKAAAKDKEDEDILRTDDGSINADGIEEDEDQDEDDPDIDKSDWVAAYAYNHQ